MYQSVCTVGERGQITIPKHIRKMRGIKAKDKVVMKVDGEVIVLAKASTKKDKARLLEEGYKKMAAIDSQIEEEMKFAGTEAERHLDEY